MTHSTQPSGDRAVASVPGAGAGGESAPLVTPMAWAPWRQATPARIALGRAGVALPTDAALRFGCDHALARDAIHTALDLAALRAQIAALGLPVLQARSCASDRATYLRRPDLGRQLHADDAQALRALAAQRAQSGAAPPDLALVLGDGLSALALQRHALPMLQALLPRLPVGHALAPVVIVEQARVAVADAIAEALGARQAVIFIGERPGLSSPDSLGLYLTQAPRSGRTDAERNCISNVRPAGLSYAAAAHKLGWLMQQAQRLGYSGVALKDGSDSVPDALDPASCAGPGLAWGAAPATSG